VPKSSPCETISGEYSYIAYMAMHTLVCSSNDHLLTHVKWLVIEAIMRVPGKEDYRVPRTWLKNY
jgi:hypothetical protein